jgi:hypothetical protein
MPGSWSDYLELRRGDAPPASTEDGDVRIYADGSGALRSVQSDGTDAAIGGGGGSTPTSASWSGSADPIDNGASGKLEWNSFDDGDESIMDADTDPFQPTVTASGIYLVSAFVSAFPMTVDGYFTAHLFLDYELGNIDNATDSRPVTGGSASHSPKACVSAGGFIRAGKSIVVEVTNNDGANAVNFSLKGGTIVKLA